MNWDYYRTRLDLERNEKWQEKVDLIPYIQFPEGWKVKIIAPFGGAYVRFLIETPHLPEIDRISVYLDMDSRLGAVDEPYWEMYPYGDDVYRVLMNDTDELMKRLTEIYEGRAND